MSVDPPPDAEEIVCDTSFVSVVQRAARNEAAKAAVAGWPEAVKDRLEKAILGISVISLAELRSGYGADGWGPDAHRESGSPR